MSCLTPNSRRRGDGQRKRKAVRTSAEAQDPEGEDEDGSMLAQSQASSRPQHSARSQESPRNVVFKIKGDVNRISFDWIQDHEETRRSVARPRTKSGTRHEVRCNTIEDFSSESEESPSSSDDNEPEYYPPSRPKRSMSEGNDQQFSERRASKRCQADEGYQTTSTAYRAEASKKLPKGKAKEGTLPSRAGNQPLKPTQQVSAGKQRKPQGAPDDLGGPSGTRSDIELNECSGDEDDAAEADVTIGASENDPTSITRDKDDAGSDNGGGYRDESEDDFNQLAMQISGVGNQDTEALDVTALLDTGTTPDWISQKFFERLKKIGIESIKLSPEEKMRKFSDFQNKSFSPTAKVCLMVQSDDFLGKNKNRLLTFFISSKSGFDILIGKDTIKKQHLFERSKPDTEGEGAHVGLHGPMSKAEEAEMKKQKEKQKKRKDERKKELDEKNEELIKEKKSAKATRSGSDSAHLATMVIRRSRNRSPLSGHSDVARQQLERKSSSSLEGAW